MKRTALACLTLALSAAPAAAQDGLSGPCQELPTEARQACYTVAQAAESAQPQLGVLVSGGNPTLGTASTGGIRLGILPRVSASARLNAVLVRIPNLRDGSDELDGQERLPVPALGANASIGVLPGISIAPTVGGVGAVDLIGSATWLPFGAAGADGFDGASEDFAYGVGARVGLLRESFTMPGVSVTLMRHRLGRVSYGEVCRGTETPVSGTRSLCAGGGDVGQVSFDLTNWSTRAAVSKRLLGLGLTAGVGYDRYSSDVSVAFRGDGGVCGTTCSADVYRLPEADVTSSRWSAFVDGSLTLLIATITAEAGWQRGGAPVSGFNAEASDFDPEAGTLFGSLGVRVSL